MAFAAKLFRTDPAERRTAPREAIDDVPSTLRGPDARPIDVMVRDLSEHGFRATYEGPLEAGDMVQIGLAGGGRAQARVMWRDADECGCAFTQPLDPAVHAAAFSGATTISPWSIAPTPYPGALTGDAVSTDAGPGTHDDDWLPRTKALVMVGASLGLWSLIALPWLL